MESLSPPWDDYLRLQTRSKRRTKIDSYSWGLEEEMNLFLRNLAVPINLPRANASAARRERAQASLRHKYTDELAPEPPSLDHQLEARASLDLMRRSMSESNWDLMLKIGQEFTQAEIAKERGVNASTLRAVVFQLRNQFHYLRPAA